MYFFAKNGYVSGGIYPNFDRILFRFYDMYDDTTVNDNALPWLA